MNIHSSIGSEQALRDMLAVNRWGAFFGVSQQVLDRVWKGLTAPEGNSVTYISMEIGADLDVFHPVKARLLELEITESSDPQLNGLVKRFVEGPEKIPNYGGGLGVLAGDTLKSFADLKVPALGITLLYRKGYFSQLVDSRLGQIVWALEWEPESTPTLYLLRDPARPDSPLEIEVPFFDRNDRQTIARAHLWLKTEINATRDFFIPELLLDYDVEGSPEWIRKSAQHLYESSSEMTKVVQRRLLGAGVIPAMKALGVTSKALHLNEQHGVAVVLHLIAERLQERYGADYTLRATDKDILEAAREVAERVVYTIHTPVKAGHDRFNKDLYAEVGHSFCSRILQLLARDEVEPSVFNFTSLAMRVNRATNAVSRLHREVTRRQFPQFADKITAITNGVHHLTWISKAKAELYDSFPELDNWRQDPGAFAHADLLLRNNKFRTYLEEAWAADSRRLTSYINEMLTRHRNQMQETWIDPPNFLSYLAEDERELRPDIFTIGFARRFSTYKRADLIFDDIDTLASIVVKSRRPVNFVFAGKAHPADQPGQSLIKHILGLQKDLYQRSNGLFKMVFIPGYDMAIAKMMVAGVHAWLNTPKRPLEASGTSGMKAAMNAVPNISTLDGWWAEGYHDGQTGWKFGYETPIDMEILSETRSAMLYAEDSDSFYELFPELLETFYDPARRPEYIDKCIMNLVLNCPKFNTHRMAAEYLERYDIALPPDIGRRIDKLRALYTS
ncbi:MAG: alpha-glucan family phosphorylase [Desulfobacteraceae bacterium]|nr:alpha-glucan family phosphorylase [Desulfobacteraceae bacterium]